MPQAPELDDCWPSSWVYLHYPLCQHHCSYCDFNVFSRTSVGAGFDDHWVGTIGRHLNAIESQKEIPMKGLYFGGGTPSLLSPLHLEKVRDLLSRFYDFSGGPEWTIEMNPEHLTLDHLTDLKNLGVNRPSLGVQTLIPSQLRRLERLATHKNIHQAIDWIQKLFENYSVDLMMGIPDQTMESLEEDLSFIRQINPPHLSIYLLTLEPEHKWLQLPAMKMRVADSELASRMYERVCEVMRERGYLHYEVSNFSKPGFQSLHNSNYWSAESDYLGLGPGAHGYLRTKDGRRIRYEMEKNPKAWGASITGLSSFEELTDEQQRLERLYLSLRTQKPISAHEFSGARLQSFRDEGLLEVLPEGIVLTEKGWLLMEAIAGQLIS